MRASACGPTGAWSPPTSRRWTNTASWPATNPGIRIHYDNPQEVGADRIADAVAAFEKYGGPAIVISFGAAITCDALSAEGDYLGGVIFPGIGLASRALFDRAARLQAVSFGEPEKLIGTNTVGSV